MSDITINAIPPCVDKAAENLTSPLSKSIGETFSELWFLILGGTVNERAEKRRLRIGKRLEEFKRELDEKIAAIPSEKLQEPNFQIVASALENSKYCVDEDEIRKLFSNLIAASMNRDLAEQIHPIFPEIIKQLSPRDASNLASFKNISGTVIAQYKEWMGHDYHIAMTNVFLQNSLYDDLEDQSASITVLETLGLVKVDYGMQASGDRSYDAFLQTKEYKKFQEMADSFNRTKFPDAPSIPKLFRERMGAPHRIELVKGMISLTALGSQFKRICIGNF